MSYYIFCHWLSSTIILSNDSFLAVGSLIAKNNSASLRIESQVIRNQVPMKTNLLPTTGLLESYWLYCILLTYFLLEIMMYTAPSLFSSCQHPVQPPGVSFNSGTSKSLSPTKTIGFLITSSVVIQIGTSWFT